jgi:TRAP transporter TAXI family solute receptor
MDIMLTMRRYAVLSALAATVMLFSSPMMGEGVGKRRFISIGTGGPKGVYHAAGNAICAMVKREEERRRTKDTGPGTRCFAPATGGSIYNLSQLSRHAFDFGISTSIWQYHAYHGTAPEKVKPYKNLRAVFSVHPEPMRIVAAKDSNIRRFRDLKNKRVNIGNPGSGQRAILEVLMKARGLSRDDFEAATELTTTEESKALCDGEIDAYITGMGVPNPRDTDVTETCGARIIALDSPIEKKLVAQTPYYVFATIPQGTYATITEDVVTMGMVATLVTRAGVSEETVYHVVRSVMENIDEFRKQHPAFAHLDPQKMIKDGLSAPLHPGALRYYQEKGWL